MWLEQAVLLAIMAVLLAGSAFFSASETAMFYLSLRDRGAFARGGRRERAALVLLADPDRFLSAILFWNLLLNLAFFTLASVVATRVGGVAAGVFSFLAVMAVIVAGEMLPKSLAVLWPRRLAAAVSLPLVLLVRLVDPLLPLLRAISDALRRVIAPGFQAENYLNLDDLERAVDLSHDSQQREQERTVLQNLVALSDVRVEEVMRPRALLATFHPPVALAAVRQVPPGGDYLLITEPEGDEIARAVNLREHPLLPEEHVEQLAEEVLYVPWSATVSSLLETMRQADRDVAVVVNELGETTGLVTFEDLLHNIFSEDPSRTARLFHRAPIRQVAPDCWHISGMANLRRIARTLEVTLPESRSVTLAGALQESLERFPELGDRGTWGPLSYEVIDASGHGQVLVEVRRLPGEEATP